MTRPVALPQSGPFGSDEGYFCRIGGVILPSHISLGQLKNNSEGQIKNKKYGPKQHMRSPPILVFAFQRN